MPCVNRSEDPEGVLVHVETTQAEEHIEHMVFLMHKPRMLYHKSVIYEPRTPSPMWRYTTFNAEEGFEREEQLSAEDGRQAVEFWRLVGACNAARTLPG